MATYYPDTYFIKLNEINNLPSLYTWNGAPIDDPRFASFGNSSFFFQIETGAPLSFGKEDAAIIWGEFGLDPEPPGICHHVMEAGSILILNVTTPLNPPQAAPAYHFKLQFKDGTVLWSHDGTYNVDPTIVENPPIGG
ncbi:MAG TPA: hypothetical protein VH988_23735 [Thermoanaerobaculia bacterium]|jgi:hypothetical protein|nr:hypothetical protein [Thermoanaerobaculia bacterium]